MIEKVFNEGNHTYGSPRITAHLNNHGYSRSKPRVAKLMQDQGLKSKVKKKYRLTTNSKHRYAISSYHLNRNFSTQRLNQVWVSGITYIQTDEGWLYLTIIIDLFDRQVIGWSLSKSLFTKQTIIPAWKMATSKRKIDQELIFHSDRGIQYASKDFRNQIGGNQLITQSMSKKENCWDNTVAESFFKTIKYEWLNRFEFDTCLQLNDAVDDYIQWYNTKRLLSTLGYKTPLEKQIELQKLKNYIKVA